MKRKRSHEDDRVRQWITKRRGILTQVAVLCRVSPQYVQMVAYGKSTSLPGNDVELELKRKGWPGHLQVVRKDAK